MSSRSALPRWPSGATAGAVPFISKEVVTKSGIFVDSVRTANDAGSVDLAFGALTNEASVPKMRVFLNDVLLGSALMRNIRKHENALQGPIADVSGALLACARGMGEKVPDEGLVRVVFDDSIIQDTEAEKERDMKEIAAGLQMPWEYRVRWYGESEEVARGNVGATTPQTA